MEPKNTSADKNRKPDLRDGLRGRATPDGTNSAGVVHEPDQPNIASPGGKEPAGQTTHE
jgi:hypothetical protein